MPAKEIALDVAAFLDSPPARALGVARDAQKTIAERFLGACYDEIGKAPRFLDGDDLHTALGHLLPGRFARADPLAEHVPAVLEAFFVHLETSQVVTQLFEIRNALASTLPEFHEAVKSGRAAHHHAHEKAAPFVHGAAKLGRNDPCSCGSGKKYKKCHGKDA